MSRNGLLVWACLVAFGQAEVREWADSTGKFRTKAEFVSLEDGKVTLRKPGSDKTVSLPLERLSDADQEYVDELVRELEEKELAEQESAADAEATVPRSNARPAAAPAKRESAAPTVTLQRPKPNNVINSVRGAVYRTVTINNMRQLAMGMIAYESQKQSYPPAAIYSNDGTPLLSWRVAILPMIDQGNLHRQFKLNEPWDSPHNKALLRQMPEIYKSPGSDLDGGFTNYLGVVGEGSMLSPNKKGVAMREVRDGTSNTIMLVEVDDAYATEWTKPSDYVWDQDQPAYGLGGIWAGQFVVALADGSVKLVPLPDVDSLNALFSRSGGEAVSIPR
jgi:hypothetical protein